MQNDAERVNCANQLWTWFNGQAVSTGGKVLVYAINAFMATIPEPHEPDLVRMFFRTQVAEIFLVLSLFFDFHQLHHLSSLLPNIPAMVRTQSHSGVDEQVAAAIEANSIISVRP